MNIPILINENHFREVLGDSFEQAKSMTDLSDMERLAIMAYLELLSEDDSRAALRGEVRSSLETPFAIGRYSEVYQKVKTKFYKQ